MGMRSVVVRVDPEGYDAVCQGKPQELTTSEWLREIVETLVARPETNYRRRMLRRVELDHLYQKPYRPTQLTHKLTFRVEAEHWAALETLARESRAIPTSLGFTLARPSMSRTEYFRQVVYRGSEHVQEWYYKYEKDASAERP